MTDKPFSQACENNKRPILEILNGAFARCSRVLEIGSGTGQHAVFLAANLPHLQWQTSDQAAYHDGIRAWQQAHGTDNCLPPRALTIGQDDIPPTEFDGIFTANTAHIMQKHEVTLLMQQVSAALPAGGVFCQYGPFTQQGAFNSDSNRDFHASLIARGYGGYRDLDELQQWAPALTLSQVHTMPANNLMLVWHKHA